MEKYKDLIAAMAAQFNTTAEALWSILIKQAFVVGIFNTVLVIAGVSFTIFICKAANKAKIRVLQGAARDEGLDFFLYGLAIALQIANSVFIWHCISRLFNPEYYALQEVIRFVN